MGSDHPGLAGWAYGAKDSLQCMWRPVHESCQEEVIVGGRAANAVVNDESFINAH